MFEIIILIISVILDGILSIYIPTTSYLIPLLTVTSIFSIYTHFKKKENTYLIIIIITGFIYDLLYTNLLFFHSIIFYILGKITKYIYKNYRENYLTNLIYLFIIITAYETLTLLILYVFKIVPFSLIKLTNKIARSLLLNLIYASIIYLTQRRIKNKLKA